MEEDNEILDWDNEDDEHHESFRKPPSNNDQRETGDIDAEDSISLGDEDEDTTTPLLTAGAKHDSQQFFGDATHGKISTPCKSSFSEDSPPRKQHSLSSPQRSQPNPSRLTHALPLKPVTTSGKPRTPHPHQTQTSRPRRNSAHMPPEREMDNGTRTVLLGPNELSYEDRHYRPGGDPHRPSGDPYRPSGDSYRPSGDSSSGQNVYTNDPRRHFETLQSHSDYAERHWVRSPPPDFSRSDRDSSRRLERRHNDNEPIDEYPDSRNRSSLRRRGSSSEPNRNQGLPPRPSEFRDDANQNPAVRRRGSTPHARDRDRHYEPIIRDFREGNPRILERDGLPRRPAEYPPPANQMPEQSNRYCDREPLRPDHVGQHSSHRKRAPLPPQAATFLTSSYTRDTTSSENGRSRTSSTLAPPPHLLSDTRDFDRGQQESGMKEGRMNRSSGQPRSRSSGRPAEYMRAPSQPSSGTNNIPIGNKRPTLPSTIPYNPDARPPPSTLINPVKARELLPPGKESYERPADLKFSDTPQAKTVNDASIHNNPRPSQHFDSSERQPAPSTAAIAPGRPRQRKSRFDKLVPPPVPRKEPSPISEKGTKASDVRAATPPPPSRDPSMASLPDQMLPLPLPAHPGNAPASSLSGPMSGRDEGGVKLSFHNAHAELERESEEGMIFQPERLARPQLERRSASLLDRLSTGNPAAQQSLRDRIIPSKRDLEDMMDEGMNDVWFDGEDGTEPKRTRRKNGRARTRGGRRGGAF